MYSWLLTYSADGKSVTIDAKNNASLYTLSGLLADASGDLVLNVSRYNNADHAILNTLTLTTVPEPTSLAALLAIAGFGLLSRRRTADAQH